MTISMIAALLHRLADWLVAPPLPTSAAHWQHVNDKARLLASACRGQPFVVQFEIWRQGVTEEPDVQRTMEFGKWGTANYVKLTELMRQRNEDAARLERARLDDLYRFNGSVQ